MLVLVIIQDAARSVNAICLKYYKHFFIFLLGVVFVLYGLSYIQIPGRYSSIPRYLFESLAPNSLFINNNSSSNISTNESKIELNKGRLFCLLLATPNSFKSTVLTVLNAWVYKCDDYRFVSKLPLSLQANPSLNEILNNTNQSVEMSGLLGNEIGEPMNIMHPRGLVQDEYLKLPIKVYHALREIYAKHGGSFDWYLKADLDTFVHVQNLKEFLSTQDPAKPITFGYDFKVIVQGGYHSGGAGYVMSREAFLRLGKQLSTGIKNCPLGVYEDTDLHGCLRRLGVYTVKSLDEKGRERFHVANIINAYIYNGSTEDGYASNPVLGGLECCSDNWVSFHRMDEKSQIRLAAIINRHERLNSMRSEPEKQTFKQVIDEWLLMEKVDQEMNIMSNQKH